MGDMPGVMCSVGLGEVYQRLSKAQRSSTETTLMIETGSRITCPEGRVSMHVP